MTSGLPNLDRIAYDMALVTTDGDTDWFFVFFFFQAEDGIRDYKVTGVQTCALPIWLNMGRVFPVGGYGNGFAGHVNSMFLPAVTVALGIVPILVRSLRASLLNVLEADYVMTARSKGLSERRVLVHHALRNAVISTVSVLGVNIAFLVGGTLVIEQVFALPGIGQLMINSIFQRDFPVVQGVTFVFAILVVLIYLATDILHSLLDPRVRFD